MPSGTHTQWKPNAVQFGAFAKAVGTRYNGRYKPKGQKSALPRVSFWSIWNEPNYGFDLAPQTTGNGSIETGAALYRGLLAHAWGGLAQSGHKPGKDTILIGEVAPRGVDGNIGSFQGVKPLRFLRALYCVDSRYNELRGSAASARGCPTTASGSRSFRKQNPGLFSASGFADHPYTSQAKPVAPNVPTSLNPRSHATRTSPTCPRSRGWRACSTTSTGSTGRASTTTSGAPSTRTGPSRRTRSARACPTSPCGSTRPSTSATSSAGSRALTSTCWSTRPAAASPVA